MKKITQKDSTNTPVENLIIHKAYLPFKLLNTNIKINEAFILIMRPVLFSVAHEDRLLLYFTVDIALSPAMQRNKIPISSFKPQYFKAKGQYSFTNDPIKSIAYQTHIAYGKVHSHITC